MKLLTLLSIRCKSKLGIILRWRKLFHQPLDCINFTTLDFKDIFNEFFPLSVKIFLFFRWMKISKKRSHFDTQWKNHIRREGKASTTTTSSILFFCFALHEHLTRARVFHGLEIVYCFSASSLLSFVVCFPIHVEHFPKYHAFSVGATCPNSTAWYYRIALYCCFTLSCGRSTQLFFVYCDCFTTTI